MAFVTFVRTRVRYHAHMEQHKMMASTEPTVINSEYPKQEKKFVFFSPFV
jgi:hypothetical protein